MDSSFRYSNQEGRINEFRDESLFDGGSIPGNFISRVDREDYVGRAAVSMDMKLTSRLKASADVRYRYRREDVDSSRVTNVAGLPLQLEEFTSDRHRTDVGASVRYRLRRGRSLEAGYRLRYETFDVDVEQIEEQFILDDFDSMSHRVYLKGRGRVVGKLRGDVRFEYVNQRRDMDNPLVDPDIFGADAASGLTQFETISFTPTLFYPLNDQISLNTSLSVRQVKLDIIDADNKPANQDLIADFEYEALTETFSIGGTYRPSQDWSGSVTYSLYHSDESVENIGHNLRLSGDFRINDTWKAYGHYGFYSYDRDGTSVDNYNAHAISLGVDARF
jgi:hypothetical protein